MTIRLLAVSVVVVTAVACAPSPKEVAQEAAGEVKTMVREALSSAESTNGLEPVTMMTRGYNAASTGTATSTNAPSAPTTANYDPSLDQLGKVMTERIFTEQNVESSGGGALIFRLMGDDLCTDGSYPADPACVDQVNRIELRIKATSPGAGAYDLTLLIGPKKLAPLTFRIRKGQSLALEVDLAQAKAAAEHINGVLNGQPLGLPRVMEGVVQLKLQKNNARDYTLSSSVLSDVRVEVDDAAGLATKFHTVRAEPLASARFDGNRRQIQLSLELGETEYTAPYKNATSSTSTVPLTVHLGGASYSLDIGAGQNDFVLAHLGLGDVQTWATYGGTKILTADLNPLAGRHFDLGFARDTDGLPLISVLPELDLTTKAYFSPLQTAGSSIESWLMDETYTVRLNGSSTPTLKPVERPGQTSGGVKVVAGSLTISTTKPGVSPLTVTAGQCVFSNPTPPLGSHGLLGRYTVQPCP